MEVFFDELKRNLIVVSSTEGKHVISFNGSNIFKITEGKDVKTKEITPAELTEFLNKVINVARG